MLSQALETLESIHTALLSFERQHLLRTLSQIGQLNTKHPLAFSQKRPTEREVHHSIFSLLPIQPIMPITIIIIIIIIIIMNSTNANVQNIFNVRIDITCSTNCEYRTTETLYTLETWFVWCIQLYS